MPFVKATDLSVSGYDLKDPRKSPSKAHWQHGRLTWNTSNVVLETRGLLEDSLNARPLVRRPALLIPVCCTIQRYSRSIFCVVAGRLKSLHTSAKVLRNSF